MVADEQTSQGVGAGASPAGCRRGGRQGRWSNDGADGYRIYLGLGNLPVRCNGSNTNLCGGGTKSMIVEQIR
jgi:hypothetical protein